jgi:sugar lactone lactonase YvrE
VVVVLSDNPDFQGVWSYDVESGVGDRLAALPCLHNHLNGSAIDAAGRIYVADSTLGIIWQVVEGEPQGRIWLRDPLLAPREYVGLAPGANGLRFWDGALYVTNSDKETVVRVPVRDDGSAGVATVHASGVPGDDFAIDDDGSMYVTTHVHDSVVEIDPAGRVLGAVATAVEGIVGSTAAIIAHDDDGARWLYVTNDGGLLAPPGSEPPRPNVSRLRLDAAPIEKNREAF